MTSPGLSWIERTLADDLVARLRAPVGRASDAPDASPPTAAALAAQPRFAPSAARVPPPEAAPSPPPQIAEPPALVFATEGLLNRVSTFCNWVAEHYHATSAFLADEHGLMVFGVRADPDYVAVIAPLIAATRSVGMTLGADASRGSLTVRKGEVLHWAETTTAHGRFCVGVLRTESANDSLLERLQEELSRTMEERTHA